MEQSQKNVHRISLVSYTLIILLAGVCVLLTLQNRELKRQLSSMTSMGNMEPLKPGERVESVKLQTLDGSSNELNYDDPTKKYLLFILSTTCPHCEKTLPAWQSLVGNNKDQCTIIGLSIHNLDETKKFITAKNVGFYVASVANDTSFGRKYKISGVPETILIDGNGIVEKTWIGELTNEQTDEIQSLMNAPKASTN